MSDPVPPLLPILQARIREGGPMPLSDYMAVCLLHPVHGYYTVRDPLGAQGDFTTAPEISQMFGELLGLALAQAWIDQGSPAAFTLAELGPGRGTLMADILRATDRVPGFTDAAEIWLVEASPALRARQADALQGHAPRWAEDVAALPQDRPLFLVANEFFDALPIRQFQRIGDIWRERVVGTGADGALRLGLSGPVGLPGPARVDVPDGGIVEVCAPAQAIMAQVAQRIAGQGGAALIVDYGDRQSRGDTFQALRGHAYADPLAAPGQADLTAHVDFGALAVAAQGCTCSAPTPQGVFLERLGITQRAQMLARGLSGAALDAHVAAHRRLTHPDEMGTLFKVLALAAPGASLPPGVDPSEE